MDPRPPVETVVDALARAFATELGRERERAVLTPAERSTAEARMARYRKDEWTWRR